MHRIMAPLVAGWALALAACGTADREAARADADTAAAAGTAGSLRRVAMTEGFDTPESVIHDAAQDVWFVSNINGSPTERDGNGYISRLHADGTVDSLRFIAGGRGGVTLHAPKGMAIVGDTLWVSDIDALRAFDRRTGAPVATIEFGARATFLNDVVAGSDGSVYVSDMGARMAEQGAAQGGMEQVFRVGPDRAVTTAVRHDSLPAPNGITWDAEAGRLLIVSMASPVLFAWAPGDTAPGRIGEAGGMNDGVELVNGMLLLTSWEDSALVAWEDGAERALVQGIGGPADLGVDRGRNRVAVPVLPAGRVEFYQLSD
jgi:sugar lactone lactonase YvrE